MKQQNSKQYAGIWLDNQNAMIIAHSDEEENGDFQIQDKVKSDEYHGGKGEHASNNADRANSLKFYKTVAGLVMKYDEIMVFGPGKAQEEFKNFLNGDSRFNNKKITIDSSEHISDPQMIAKVREYFKGHQS